MKINFKNREFSLSICFFFLLPFLIFPDVFFGNYSLDPASLYDIHFSKNETTSIYHVELASSVFYERPLNFLFGSLLKDFIVPNYLFNVSLGFPVFEQLSTKLFAPIQILENILSLKDVTFFTFLRIYVASAFIFATLVTLNVRPVIASLCTAMVCASGIFVWFLGLQQMHNVFVTLSLCCFVAAKYPTLNLKSFLLNLISFVLLIVSGQPEIAIFCFPILYLIVLSDINPSNYIYLAKCISKKTLLFCLCILLSLLISYPAIEPFISGFTSQNIWTSLHGLDGAAGVASPAPKTLANILLFPNISNYPFPLRFYPLNGHLDFVGFYIGLPCLILILLNLLAFNFSTRADKLFIFLFLYSLVLLLKNFGIEPFFSLGKLPLFNLVWSPRWSNAALNISSIFMILISLNSIVSKSYSNTLKTLTKQSICIFAVGFACYFAWTVVPSENEPFLHGLHYWNMVGNPSYFNPFLLLPSLTITLVSILFILVMSNNVGQEPRLNFLILGLLLFSFVAVPRNYSPAEVSLLMKISVASVALLIILVTVNSPKINKLKYLFIIVTLPTTLLIFQSISGGSVKQGKNSHRSLATDFFENNPEFKNYNDFRFGFSPNIAQGNEGSHEGINILSGVFSLPPSSTVPLFENNFFELSQSDKVPWYSGYQKYKIFNEVITHRISQNKEDIVSSEILDDLGVKYFISTHSPDENVCLKNIENYCVQVRENASRLYEVFKDNQQKIDLSDEIKLNMDNKTQLKLDFCWEKNMTVRLKFSFLDRLKVSYLGNRSIETSKGNDGLISFILPEDFCGPVKIHYVNPITDKIYFPYITILSLLFFGILFNAVKSVLLRKY